MENNLENPWLSGRGKLHFVGIAGAGMSALAFAALQRGLSVSGSELRPSPQLDRLRQAGARVYSSHGNKIPADTSLVIYSSAIPSDNPDLKEASLRKLPLLHRAQLLAFLFETKRSIAVAGSHGKTSTSSELAWVMASSGQKPAFAVGGRILQWEKNGGWGPGDFLVAEADESDGSFLRFRPDITLITGVELDHVRRYLSLKALRKTFREFVKRTRDNGTLIYPVQDAWLAENLPQTIRTIPFGPGTGKGFRLESFKQKKNQVLAQLILPNRQKVSCQVPGFGFIAAINALAATAAAMTAGVTWEQVQNSLASYPGVARRLEIKSGTGNILLIEDYAHHPTEIQAAIAAVRSATKNRLVAVFEPHRYSRMAKFSHELAKSLLGANEIILAELYGAFEPKLKGIDSLLLLNQLKKLGRKAYGPFPIQNLAETILPFLDQDSTCLLMGAGRITETAQQLRLLLASSPQTSGAQPNQTRS